MEDCVFCKIVKGEIPSLKVYEDQDTISILDINPANYGHLLVIPKQHYENIYNIPDDILQKVIVVVKKMAVRVKNNLSAEGVNIVQNNEQPAGQIVKHFHIHVIPRYQGDKVVITYERLQPTPEKVKEVVEKLSSEVVVTDNRLEHEEDIPPEEKFGI